MRRYPMILILLLSFAMPFQVAAEALLSALPCPDMVSMNHQGMSMESESHAGMMAKMAAPISMDMDCCDDQTNQSSRSDNNCGSMKNCQMCKTGSQFISDLSQDFSVARSSSLEHVFALPLVLPFSSADVWRPPTNS